MYNSVLKDQNRGVDFIKPIKNTTYSSSVPTIQVPTYIQRYVGNGTYPYLFPTRTDNEGKANSIC